VGFDARRLRPDVFHSPGIDPPLLYRGPWVQTLHDVIPLVYPDDDWGLDVPRWRVRGRLMRSADAVICISAHTASLAVRLLGIDPKRLHVIHHGVTPIFRQSVEPFEPDRPFVLYVGAFGPHKGFAEAFDVIARVADAGLPHVLRVVGGMNGATREAVDALVRSARQPDRIEIMGRVSDEALLRLYHGADALVVTSRYEGFGRPTIEALATGTPVVSFDNSSLGEILGDGGLHIPDGDVERFSSELVDLLRDDTARRDLSRCALARSLWFDWDRCATEHVAVYDAVA
jgi:glycosyltransferase involved in cell wall biosynthesis